MIERFIFEDQRISGLKLIKPRLFKDDRGYFLESFRSSEVLPELGVKAFVQENESKSAFGVLRGLHFQRAPHAQAKLLRVIEGRIWDVAVDLRQDSETYLQYLAVELSDENHHQFFIPKGFAHGFLVLSETAIVQYKTDDYYAPEADAGVHPYDETVNIPWPLKKAQHILSKKDQQLPRIDV